MKRTMVIFEPMELTTAIELIKPVSKRFSQTASWADLGCGTGLFTTALASLLMKGSKVYAVDKDRKSLNKLEDPEHVTLQKIVGDFSTDSLPFSGLDGILMANSLHYVRDQHSFIQKSLDWLTNNGCFLLIEYDSDVPNPWVPYPLSLSSAKTLFQRSGFNKVQKLG